MKTRRRIPDKLTSRLLAAHRHTCCICQEPRHPVEKHHIKGDPSDNRGDDLAVLCQNCHGLVIGKSNLGCQYTPQEIFLYKRDWERRCAEADEIDSPVEEFHETAAVWEAEE